MLALKGTIQDNVVIVEDEDIKRYEGQTDAQDYIKKMRENERIEN